MRKLSSPQPTGSSTSLELRERTHAYSISNLAQHAELTQRGLQPAVIRIVLPLQLLNFALHLLDVQNDLVVLLLALFDLVFHVVQRFRPALLDRGRLDTYWCFSLSWNEMFFILGDMFAERSDGF